MYIFQANSPPPLATVLAARRATGSNPLHSASAFSATARGGPRRNVCLAIRRLPLGLHLVMGNPLHPGYPIFFFKIAAEWKRTSCTEASIVHLRNL